MNNKVKLYLMFILFFFLSCRKQLNKNIHNKSNITFENNCQIPKEVKAFLDENSNQWSKVNLNAFDKELIAYLSNQIEYNENQMCPYSVYGDFTNDGMEDFGIILKNNNYKVNGFDNYQFPFLVVFNNYKYNLEVEIVCKTGDYEEDEVKTVIYSDYEYGILSYLKNNQICGINIIDIIYFEKSSFFVYWDNKSKKYQFLNHLDTNLCDKIKNDESISFEGDWNYDCKSELFEFSIDENKEVFMFLYPDNSIYINCFLRKKEKGEYNLFFKNVASQEYYYEDKKNIVEEDISKEKSIGTITVIDNTSIELKWRGLYNAKTKEIDFTQLKESNNPIILKKCDS